MQQWSYCGLRVTDEGLYLIKYTPKGHTVLNEDPMKPDSVLDENLRSLVRRCIARLGTEGWELTALFGETEFVFKKPMS